MKKYILLLLILAFSSANGKDVCQKCERIREHNKLNPGDYEYYDDYLKALEKGTKDKKISKD